MRAWLLVAAAMLLAGCIDPYQARVPPDVLTDTGLSWTVEGFPVEGEGWFGQRSTEVRYKHEGSASGPPFPGVLQLFSVRQGSRIASDDLAALTTTILEDAAAREGIQLDVGLAGQGTRSLASGVQTSWSILGGTVRSGGLFAQDETVRILGESWYDGRSKTGVVVVALAQTTQERPFPLDPVRNERTWQAIVGDPGGTIDGARSGGGMVYHVESHG